MGQNRKGMAGSIFLTLFFTFLTLFLGRKYAIEWAGRNKAFFFFLFGLSCTRKKRIHRYPPFFSQRRTAVRQRLGCKECKKKMLTGSLRPFSNQISLAFLNSLSLFHAHGFAIPRVRKKKGTFLSKRGTVKPWPLSLPLPCLRWEKRKGSMVATFIFPALLTLGKARRVFGKLGDSCDKKDRYVMHKGWRGRLMGMWLLYEDPRFRSFLSRMISSSQRARKGFYSVILSKPFAFAKFGFCPFSTALSRVDPLFGTTTFPPSFPRTRGSFGQEDNGNTKAYALCLKPTALPFLLYSLCRRRTGDVCPSGRVVEARIVRGIHLPFSLLSPAILPFPPAPSSASPVLFSSVCFFPKPLLTTNSAISTTAKPNTQHPLTRTSSPTPTYPHPHLHRISNASKASWTPEQWLCGTKPPETA